jgi:predicted heme/steroid binding protein
MTDPKAPAFPVTKEPYVLKAEELLIAYGEPIKEYKSFKNAFILGCQAALLRYMPTPVISSRGLYNNPTGKPYCCSDGCGEDATHLIIYGSGLEDQTHSCAKHIAELLVNDFENTVTLITQLNK